MTATTWTVKNARVKQQNPLPRYHNPRTSKSQYPTKHYFRLQNHAVGNFSFLIPHRNAAPAPHLARPRRLCQPPWTQPISRNPRHLAWARKFEETYKSIPIHSSGEGGLGGEALLLEKRPLPPVRFLPRLFGREREGGASRREAASLAYPPRLFFRYYYRHT